MLPLLFFPSFIYLFIFFFNILINPRATLINSNLTRSLINYANTRPIMGKLIF